jgi:hypothetical protein
MKCKVTEQTVLYAVMCSGRRVVMSRTKRHSEHYHSEQGHRGREAIGP